MAKLSTASGESATNPGDQGHSHNTIPVATVTTTGALSAKGAQLSRPEFGKASPIRNPLKQPNIFNANVRRPEHHRRPIPGTKNQFYHPAQELESASNIKEQTKPQSTFAPVTRDGFFLPGQKSRQHVPAAGVSTELSADFFEIAKPKSSPPKTIQAAPRPTFSSLGPKTVFQPFKPTVTRPQAQVIVIDDDDEPSFEPDRAFADDRFGAIDPYAYVDPGKASQDVKALLEGAFDEDEDRPRTRLRDRVRKPPSSSIGNTTLEEKLSQLSVQMPGDTQASDTLRDQHGEDDEDGTVDGMAVKLLPHQLEGVRWMLDKESGERAKSGVLPKGGILVSSKSSCIAANMLTIMLADDMGLGKTVQSVTLILLNPRTQDEPKLPDGAKRRSPGKDVGKGTLVVAPLALIRQWESEIKSKVSPSHALRVLVHHGPSRTKSHLELKKYDVVITTYQILASEHAASSEKDDGIKAGCFGVHWYRIILDEAHSIKNKSAKSTQACCALKSWYRWCLTGTPMQNNLDELQSLIHFLRIKPYNNVSHWKQQITVPMKNGKGTFAIKRVQYFLKGIMKRRTKDILKQEGALNFGGKKDSDGSTSQGMMIVKREIKSVVCHLDDYERELYDKLAQRANDRIQSMMGEAKTDYIGALVLLLRLRQVCNHPQLIKSAMQKDKDALDTAGMGIPSPQKRVHAASTEVDDLADLLGGLGVKTTVCDVCQANLSKEEVQTSAIRCFECEQDLGNHKGMESGKGTTDRAKVRTLRRARRVVHDSDDDNEEGDGEWLVSPTIKPSRQGQAGDTDDENAEGGGHSLGSIDSDTDSDDSDHKMKHLARSARKRRSDRSGSSSDTSSQATRSSILERPDDSYVFDTSAEVYPSTKIRRLVNILRHETPRHKVIVFSQFTTMLDLIQPHLQSAQIPFTRYDGSLPNPAREAALHSLRNDPSTRVLLCSLKCGSLGLNLTAASRVVIVEPFWNPFVEEQAIDRVHRLNQTVDVIVYKLTVRDTVEERILELQEKKRELARAAIEGGKAIAKLSLQDLLGLFGGRMDVEVQGQQGPADRQGLLARPRQDASLRGTVAIGGPVSGQRIVSGGSSSGKRVAERAGTATRTEDSVYGRR